MTICDELTSQRGGHTTGYRKTIECENIWNQLWKLLRISSLSSELFKNPELVIKVEIKQIKHEHQPQGKHRKGCWSYHCHILPNPVNNQWHLTEHKAPWQKLQRGMLRIVRQVTWTEHPDPTWLFEKGSTSVRKGRSPLSMVRESVLLWEWRQILNSASWEIIQSKSWMCLELNEKEKTNWKLDSIVQW